MPSLLFARLHIPLTNILAGGFLLAAPLTLTIAVAEVGVRVHELTEGARGIDREQQGVLILLAIAMGLAAPYLARFLLPSVDAPPEKIAEENKNNNAKNAKAK